MLRKLMSVTRTQWQNKIINPNAVVSHIKATSRKLKEIAHSIQVKDKLKTFKKNTENEHFSIEDISKDLTITLKRKVQGLDNVPSGLN